MLDKIFSALTLALSDSFELALLAAFTWGLASIILSPCHLASIPLLIGYLSRQKSIGPKKVFYLSCLFALGILVTLTVIGLVTAATGHILGDIGWVGRILVLLIFLFAGLYLLDLIQIPLPSLNLMDTPRNRNRGAFLLGLLFGFSLGPCTFAFMAPVLGLIFSISADHYIHSIMLLGAFALGHCSVIVAAGGLMNIVQKYLDWSGNIRVIPYLRRIFGLLVLCAGAYYFYQYMI
jgi:cytochrome c-type biogenesis protein